MTNEPLLLSIDLGTTACRAFVVTSSGKILGESGHDCPLAKTSETVIEQHAQDWWRVACVACREAIADSGRHGKDIRGVSVSSQGLSIVPVDEFGEVLRPAISWLDTRASEEIRLILENVSRHELFQITGKRPDTFHSLPKMMWIKRHEPEIFAKTRYFLLPHDYLVYRLTGRFVTDHSLASGTLAHDVARLEWSRRMLEVAGVEPGMLPDIVWAGTPVSTIAEECAETLGVSRQAVVTCGGQDRKCAALSLGAKQGVVTASLGTASAISAVIRSPALDAEARVLCFPFVVPHTWCLEGVVLTAGRALRWYKDVFLSGGYELMDEMADQAFDNTGNLFFYPHLIGAGSPIWNPNMPGVLWGIAPATDASDIARAVLEGVAYQIRSNVETMVELGVEVDLVKIFGGGAKSETWLQMISDILGREVKVPSSTEAAAMGACVLAGVGSGVYSSVEEGTSVFERGERTVEPDARRSREYEERYARYRDIENNLAGGGAAV